MNAKGVALAASVLLLSVVTAILVLWPGAPSGPAAIAYGKDACARCRMVISQPGWGGEIRDSGGRLSKYDDLGCLLRDLGKAGFKAPGVWVEAVGGGELVTFTKATFVLGSKLTTPMGYGMVAFADPSRAKALAAEGGEVLPIPEVVAWVKSMPAELAPDEEGGSPQAHRPLSAADAAAGKAVFLRECAACHGERADGAGAAAPLLSVAPRNFLTGKFKLRTTPSGDPPATSDILRTIERGIPGSGMPAFGFLSATERKQVAAYVLDRAGLLDGPEPVPVPAPPALPPRAEATVAKGKELYGRLGCIQCHGAGGRGDGPAAALLKDDSGQPIPVRDLTAGVFRGGGERIDLYYRFTTGMDGTPMPSFSSGLDDSDRFALVDFIQSLQVAPPPATPAGNPREAGNRVLEKYSCRACHTVDAGKGGTVGPDLRLSGAKLHSEWVRPFLSDPRAWGKIYPWRTNRMPAFPFDPEEIEALTKYLASIGGRPEGPRKLPDPTLLTPERVAEGKGLYVLKCSECHNLGRVVELAPVKQQGPDLIRVAGRVDWDYASQWIMDPKKLDPKTKMTVPGITQEQVELIKAFVWKTSMDAGFPAAR